MIETDVLTALQTAGIAAVAASAIPAMPIKAIDRVFNPATDAPDGKYVEFVNIVNNRGGDYWDDSRVYQGTFRIILHWPVDDAGAYPSRIYLDQLASFFPKGKTLASGAAIVQIYDVPNASGSITDGSELLLPVSLSYRCFKS